LIAFDVRHYDSIDSTSDEAMRLARAGAAHGTVVCAREQTAGRGRRARQWHSPAGNLHASILLRLELVPGVVAQLSFVTALAVADAVDALLPRGVRAALKWPNDVLVRGAKVAGILIEATGSVVVVGIGINVRHAPSDAPYPVTTLGVGSVRSVLDLVLAAFSRRLDEWQSGGFGATRRDWLARAHPPGTTLHIVAGDRTIEGRFVELAADGALVVDTDDGPRRCVAGEVAIVGAGTTAAL
jgi:BirA family transcriptional regulator, biotin operon repressor / biotin---[acetyl-CoA-carboxylase] ligase